MVARAGPSPRGRRQQNLVTVCVLGILELLLVGAVSLALVGHHHRLGPPGTTGFHHPAISHVEPMAFHRRAGTAPQDPASSPMVPIAAQQTAT